MCANQASRAKSTFPTKPSLRAYLDVNRRSPYLVNLSAVDARPLATQCVAEFVMQPRQLMQGNAVMNALNPHDYRFETAEGLFPPEADEPFETGAMPDNTRLNRCMSCHGGAGAKSVKTIGFRHRLFLKEGSPEAISKATSTRKRDHDTWKTLHELWQADLKEKGARFPAPADQPQPPLDNKGSTTHGAEDAADPYDVLYDVIMVRKDSDGKAYSTNEVGPLIYGRSEFPFDNETFPRLTKALERFNALSQAQIESYDTVRRSLLQRHLWVVFDATIPKPNDYKPPTHLDRRRETQTMLATLIQRVALTEAEILALPDTRAATIKRGGFPQEHDPTDRFKAFLPADLYAIESSWVTLGKVGNPDTDHARIDRWRSAFFQFVRLPGGREATLEYIKKLNDREVFPVGTQFALIDQAFLISDRGELVLSPVINSIQLRAYLNVTMTALDARPNSTVCVSEFVMQPEQLKKGKFAMRALGPKDFRFQTLSADTGGRVDPLEGVSVTKAHNRSPSLQRCVFCHERNRPGVRSLGDFMHGDRFADKLTFEPSSPATIAQAVAAAKREDRTWKKLQELWQKD